MTIPTKAGLYVSLPPESVKALTKGILEIIEAKADQETIRKALEVMAKGVDMQCNITNCTFNNK